MNTSDDNINKDKSNSKASPRKGRRLVLKVFAVIVVILIAGLATIPFLFSNSQIASLIEDKFQTATGLELSINDLDLQLFNENIVLRNVSCINTDGKPILGIERVALKITIKDLYNLYMYNKVQIKSLELDELFIADIPYQDLLDRLYPGQNLDQQNQEIIDFLQNSRLDISNLRLKHLSDNRIEYSIESSISGDYTGNGRLSGIISNFKDGDPSKISITANTTDYSLDIDSEGIEAKYSGDLEYAAKMIRFTGTLSTNQTPLEILNANPNTTYKGSGQWDLTTDTISIPDATITNPDGLIIKAGGQIIHPIDEEKFTLSAKINESTAQLPTLQTPDSSIDFNFAKGFSFLGTVYIAPDKLDISGDITAEDIILNNNSNVITKASLTTHLKATMDALLFDDFSAEAEDSILSVHGSTYIPISSFSHSHNSLFNYTDIEVDLDAECKLNEAYSKLSQLSLIPENTLRPEGNLKIRLLAQPTNDSLKTTISLGSENDDITLTYGNNRRLKLGRVFSRFDGIINNDQITFDTINIKTAPAELSARISAVNNSDNVTIAYDFTTNPNVLIPFILPESRHSYPTIKSVKITGEGDFTQSTAEFKSAKSKVDFQFTTSVQPSAFSITGPLSLTAKNDWAIILEKAILDIYNTDIISNKTDIICSASINAQATLFQENNSQLYPTGSAHIGARSRDSALLQFIMKLTDHDSIPFNTNETVLKAKMNFSPVAIDISTNFSFTDFITNNPIDFSEDSIVGSASLRYEVADKRIHLYELKFSDKEKNYEYTAAGKFYTENAIFEQFTSKLTADIDKLLQNIKGYGENKRVYGRIEMLSELIGTTDAPSLTIVGKSDRITIGKNNYGETFDNVSFDSRLNWSRESDGSIIGLKVDEAFFKSSNASLFFTGISERFNLLKSGIVDFGKGCNVNMLLKGNRSLLSIVLPGYKPSTTDPNTKDSITLSTNIQAKKLPLFNFEKEVNRSYINQIILNNGKFSIDQITHDAVTISDISADFALKNGIANLKNGKGTLFGDISFSSTADFNGIPHGKFNLNLSNIDLASTFREPSSENQILNGYLNLPNNSPDSSLEIFWKGSTPDEVLKSLKTKDEKASIKDLVIESINKRHDWEEYLSTDFPPIFAKELAKQIDLKLSPTYGKKKKSYYKYFNINYKLNNGAIRINQISCGGGNTADLIIIGIISYTGRIKFRIYPVKNISKSIDTRTMMDIPTVHTYTQGLSPSDKARLYKIIPQRLENLARQRKLYIDITGTVDNPVINIDNLKNEIRKKLPAIIKEFNSIIGQGGILQLLLKDVKSDKLKDALNTDNKDSIINSGSSFGDLIKLLD